MAKEIKIKYAQVGDIAMIDGMSNFCTGGSELITAIKTKYNEDTGEPYNVICCGESQYKATNGRAITEPTGYYISSVYRVSEEELKEYRRCERNYEVWIPKIEELTAEDIKALTADIEQTPKSLNNSKRPYVLWRRVSTKQQGESGLGLDAQLSIAEYFMQGKPVKIFTDVYSGTKLAECPNLGRAMKYCKEHGHLLVIAKTDRFRNVKQALNVLDEMGEGNIHFCDLPTTDRTVLTIVFAVWERQATMGQINTKRGLEEARKRGVRLGRPADFIDKNGKEHYDLSAANEASARARADRRMLWIEQSSAVKFARRKRAENWRISDIVDELGMLFDDEQAKIDALPDEKKYPNPYATPTGCKPQKGTVSMWLRESNPLILAV